MILMEASKAYIVRHNIKINMFQINLTKESKEQIVERKNPIK